MLVGNMSQISKLKDGMPQHTMLRCDFDEMFTTTRSEHYVSISFEQLG